MRKKRGRWRKNKRLLKKLQKKSIGKSSKGSTTTRDTEGKDSPGVGQKRINKFKSPDNGNDSSDEDPSKFQSNKM